MDLPFGEHRRRDVVTVQPRGGEDEAADQLDQGRKARGAGAY